MFLDDPAETFGFLPDKDDDGKASAFPGQAAAASDDAPDGWTFDAAAWDTVEASAFVGVALQRGMTVLPPTDLAPVASTLSDMVTANVQAVHVGTPLQSWPPVVYRPYLPWMADVGG